MTLHQVKINHEKLLHFASMASEKMRFRNCLTVKKQLRNTVNVLRAARECKMVFRRL